MKFGLVPPEPPASNDLTLCAPQFAVAVERAMLELERQGFDPIINEAWRSDERQAWLYAFGRDYDDGRGIVTNAPNARHGWHFFGLAADIISAKDGWDSPDFFDALQIAAAGNGLTSGSDWRVKDRPHVQWGKCKPAPSDVSATLFEQGGNHAVWQAVGAA